ncbi:MAG: SOS response-associated peptidase [Bacteroidota bacterium]
MCFTIAMHLPRETITSRFEVDAGALKDYDFRFYLQAFANPLVPVIPGTDPGRISLMQWGLIPSWCRDMDQAEEIRKGTYNARAESLERKSSFKTPLEMNRCLVITGGFFEWQHVAGKKTPWFITLREGGPMALAGLCDRWMNPADQKVYTTFSIVTTSANPLMEKIHNSGQRMPVILPPGKDRVWIDPLLPAEKAKQLLLPYPEEEMDAWTVSPRLLGNKSDPYNPEVIQRVEHYTPGSLF